MESNPVLLWFSLFRSVIGLETLTTCETEYTPNKKESWLVVCPSFSSWPVFPHWLITMQKFVIIGCCNYFDFCRAIENCSKKNNELRIFVQQLWNITHPGYSYILLVPLYFGCSRCVLTFTSWNWRCALHWSAWSDALNLFFCLSFAFITY